MRQKHLIVILICLSMLLIVVAQFSYRGDDVVVKDSPAIFSQPLNPQVNYSAPQLEKHELVPDSVESEIYDGSVNNSVLDVVETDNHEEDIVKFQTFGLKKSAQYYDTRNIDSVTYVAETNQVFGEGMQAPASEKELLNASKTFNAKGTQVPPSYQSIFDSPSARTLNNSVYLYIAITILSISTLIAVGVSFYLYKWRRIILAKPNSVVPEEWAKYLQSVGENVAKLSSAIDINLTRVNNESRLHSERIESMTNTYLELQGVLDEKDKEINRFKDGYDAEIFRKFIGRFARVDQALEDLIAESTDTEDLSLLRRLLEDAFEECGVERSYPNVGDDYRTVYGVSDNPKVKHTNDSSLEFRIAEVIECGYELNAGIERKSIIPSKVKIYKHVEEAQ